MYEKEALNEFKRFRPQQCCQLIDLELQTMLRPNFQVGDTAGREYTLRVEDEDEDVITRGHVHSRGGCHFDEQH